MELLIAFAILSLSLTAVVLVAFGNQAYAIDTELAQRALYLAEKKLDETIGGAANDYDDFLALQNSTTDFGRYTSNVTITDISECAKRVDSTISWTQGLRNLDTILSSVVINTDASDIYEHDCATEEPGGEWDDPAVFVDENIIGQSDATAIDEFDHMIYLTTDPSAANKNDFFIYEFDPDTITLTEMSHLNTSAGFNVGLFDVDVAGNYAFVASGSTTAQLQVIDISDPLAPSVVWEVPLPGVDPTGSYPEGRSVRYHSGRVYVGTAETDGPEFHVFDVTNVNIVPPFHLGSLELTHNVNEIIVEGDYAYLATSDNNHELMAIDVSNPAAFNPSYHPDVTNLGFNAPGANDGTSIYVGADRIYLGRAQNNPPTDSFFILNKSDVLDNANASDGVLGAHDIGLSNNTYVAGIRVAGKYAFLSLDQPTIGLVIYDVTDPVNIALPAPCSAYNFAENSVGIDNDSSNEFLFVANSSNSEIRIIYDPDTSCPI